MNYLPLILALLVMSLSSGVIPVVNAAPLFPDTGQTACYQNDFPFAAVPCAGTGQDGAYSINPLSYTDNGTTITDNNTGLVWQKCTVGLNSDTACSGSAATMYNWYQASGTYDAVYNPATLNVCTSVTLGNRTDWRLPTKLELMSIVDYSVPTPGPTIAGAFFPNTKAADYWTATSYAEGVSKGFYVGFQNGYVYFYYKSNSALVRCVRTGP